MVRNEWFRLNFKNIIQKYLTFQGRTATADSQIFDHNFDIAIYHYELCYDRLLVV